MYVCVYVCMHQCVYADVIVRCTNVVFLVGSSSRDRVRHVPGYGDSLRNDCPHIHNAEFRRPSLAVACFCFGGQRRFVRFLRDR